MAKLGGRVQTIAALAAVCTVLVALAPPSFAVPQDLEPTQETALSVLSAASQATDRAMVTETIKPGSDQASRRRNEPEPAVLEAASVPFADADADASPTRFSEQGLPPFSLIGASWLADGSAVSAQIRIHDASGWQAWRELATEDGGAAPTTENRAVTDPLWVGSADGFELVVTGSARDVAVHLVRPGDEPAGASPRSDSGSLAVAALDTTAPDAAALAVAALAAPSPEPGTVDPASIPAAAGVVERARLRRPGADAATNDDGAVVDGAAPSAAVASTGPQIHSRSEWGSRPFPVGGYDAAPGAKLAVLHHTVDTNGYGPGDVPAMLRAIQAYHTDANGWYDIGYNFLIDQYGRIWEGRGGGTEVTIVGAHTFGFNTGAVGVAFLGDFRSATPTRAAIDAAVSLLSWRLFLDGADPGQPARVFARGADVYPAGVTVELPRIIGHGDANFTSCPAGVRSAMAEIRNRVSAGFRAQVSAPQLNPTRLEDPPTRDAPLAGDFDGDGDGDLLWATSDTAEFWFTGENGGFVVDPHPRSPSLRPLVADFDGNGTTDVYWWSPAASDRDMFWMMEPGGHRREREQLIDGAIDPYAFDPDGDGDNEILWYDPVGGHVWLWVSHGPGGFSQVDLGAEIGPGLVPTMLDADGDARDDVLWYHPARSSHFFWRSTTTTEHIASVVGADPGHNPSGADLNGDGFEDLILSGGPIAVVAWGPRMDTFAWVQVGDVRQVTVADTDGGGAFELVTVGADGSVARHAFALDRTPAAFPAVYGSLGSVTAADTNRDGRDELLLTTWGGFQRWTAG